MLLIAFLQTIKPVLASVRAPTFSTLLSTQAWRPLDRSVYGQEAGRSTTP
jgi:hypothetical protein